MKTRFSFEKRTNTNLRQKLCKMKTINETDSFLVLYILFTLYRLAQHKIVLPVASIGFGLFMAYISSNYFSSARQWFSLSKWARFQQNLL